MTLQGTASKRVCSIGSSDGHPPAGSDAASCAVLGFLGEPAAVIRQSQPRATIPVGQPIVTILHPSIPAKSRPGVYVPLRASQHIWYMGYQLRYMEREC